MVANPSDWNFPNVTNRFELSSEGKWIGTQPVRNSGKTIELDFVLNGQSLKEMIEEISPEFFQHYCFSLGFTILHDRPWYLEEKFLLLSMAGISKKDFDFRHLIENYNVPSGWTGGPCFLISEYPWEGYPLLACAWDGFEDIFFGINISSKKDRVYWDFASFYGYFQRKSFRGLRLKNLYQFEKEQYLAELNAFETQYKNWVDIEMDRKAG